LKPTTAWFEAQGKANSNKEAEMTVAITGRVGHVDQPVARGVLFVHSCPRAIAAHVDWALTRTFGSDIHLDWDEQPLLPGHVRVEVVWTAPPGTGAALASALRSFPKMRFEVTEDGSTDREGERFAVTPALGLFRAAMGRHGDLMVHEERLRQICNLPPEQMRTELDKLIGTPWDIELEPFRAAAAPSTVRLLHEVG
jgi:hypothetical protein